ncbi:MAG: hypothetical protein B9S33_17125 [Pedosphaera sp. Tous-C6FEB]|nr:MAG: hypothetical protein B9S33_17125 [Pedosphaera sp. Tous-C6FEB]
MRPSAHLLFLLLTVVCAPAAEPAARNPVVIFRDLLAMRTDAREKELAAKPERLRTVLTSRLREYDSLSPLAREARLRSTELRYHLHPLLTMPLPERAAKVAAVPESFRALVAERLAAWDKLPAEIQREVLANERLVQAITRPAVPNAFPPLPPGLEPKVPDDLVHWQSLGPLQREQLLDSFTHYFRLDEQAKTRVVASLPAPKRAETARTLDQLDQLSPEERAACLTALRRLGQMSPAEQARFYANAEQWQKMSEQERNAWRKVVTEFPPLPPGAGLPPLPPLNP